MIHQKLENMQIKRDTFKDVLQLLKVLIVNKNNQCLFVKPTLLLFFSILGFIPTWLIRHKFCTQSVAI